MPGQLVDLLAGLAASPIVRYELQSSALPTADVYEGSCLARAPDRRRAGASAGRRAVAPDEFAPLHTMLKAAGGRRARTPLLEPPPADDVPLTLE